MLGCLGWYVLLLWTAEQSFIIRWCFFAPEGSVTKFLSNAFESNNQILNKISLQLISKVLLKAHPSSGRQFIQVILWVPSAHFPFHLTQWRIFHQPHIIPTAYMVSKHGPYLVFSLISGLPIKPGRTSGAMLVEDSGEIVVEASGGCTVHRKRDPP